MKCFPQSGWCDGREDCTKGEDEAVCTMISLCHDDDDIKQDMVEFPRRPPPAVLHFDGYGTLHVMDMSGETAALTKVRDSGLFLIGLSC